ncbi:MAG: hypothetical protein HYX27_22950 [Acidobacteria bacterium]|nr:hypothetical protein [Acidobacteriota bacterium]
MSVIIEKQQWKGWPNCWRLSNGTVELIVTQDVGPRVMRYAFAGGQNLFKEFTEQLGKSGETGWCIRGGHRLWKGPEDRHATYALDNSPIDIQASSNTLTATQMVEPETGLQKRIELQLASTGSEVTVKHTIWNRGLLPVEIAAWTPTVMAQSGLGVTGFPPRGTHPEDLEPTNPLIMWAFTDLTDPRWKFTNKYLTLRQDPANPRPQKLGHWNAHTFGAYFLNGEIFLKEFFPTRGMAHPEFGASFEIFTNQDFLELETMGPFMKLAKDEALTHVEHWSLHKGSLAEISDAAIDAAIRPLLRT